MPTPRLLTLAGILLLAPAFPLAAGDWIDEVGHDGCEGETCHVHDFDLSTVCLGTDCATLRIATTVECSEPYHATFPWRGESYDHRRVCGVSDETYVTFQSANLCAEVTILDGTQATRRLCGDAIQTVDADGAPGPTAFHTIYTIPGGGGLDDLDVMFCVESESDHSCRGLTRTRGLFPTGTTCCTDGGYPTYDVVIPPQRHAAPALDTVFVESEPENRPICSHVPTCAMTEIELSDVSCNYADGKRTCEVTYKQWVQGHGIGCHRLLLATDESTPGLEAVDWTPDYTTVCGVSLIVGTLDDDTLTFEVAPDTTQLITRALLCTGESAPVDHHSGHACRTWLLPTISIGET